MTMDVGAERKRNENENENEKESQACNPFVKIYVPKATPFIATPPPNFPHFSASPDLIIDIKL